MASEPIRIDVDGAGPVEVPAGASFQDVLAKAGVGGDVLAAFAGCEVDNAIIELDANEPPIADGSAREYLKLIEAAGTVALPEKREPYTITAPLS